METVIGFNEDTKFIPI